ANQILQHPQVQSSYQIITKIVSIQNQTNEVGLISDSDIEQLPPPPSFPEQEQEQQQEEQIQQIRITNQQTKIQQPQPQAPGRPKMIAPKIPSNKPPGNDTSQNTQQLQYQQQQSIQSDNELPLPPLPPQAQIFKYDTSDYIKDVEKLPIPDFAKQMMLLHRQLVGKSPQERHQLVCQRIIPKLAAMFTRAVNQGMPVQIQRAAQGVGQVPPEVQQKIDQNKFLSVVYAARIPLCEALAWAVKDDSEAASELVRGGDFFSSLQIMLITLTVLQMNNLYLLPVAEALIKCSKIEASAIYDKGLIQILTRFLQPWETYNKQELRPEDNEQFLNEEEQTIHRILNILERLLQFKSFDLDIGKEHPYAAVLEQSGTLSRLRDLFNRANNKQRSTFMDEDILKLTAVVLGHLYKAQPLKFDNFRGEDLIQILQQCAKSQENLAFRTNALSAISDLAENAGFQSRTPFLSIPFA
ncbi:MAG: hypothetical protein EZS28_038024, partial [Streblomastix strix]